MKNNNITNDADYNSTQYQDTKSLEHVSLNVFHKQR